jgi:hypothetical protein
MYYRPFKRTKRWPLVANRQKTRRLFLRAITTTPRLREYVQILEFNFEWGAPFFVYIEVYETIAKLRDVVELVVVVKDRITGKAFHTLPEACMKQLQTMMRVFEARKVTLRTPNWGGSGSAYTAAPYPRTQRGHRCLVARVPP